MSTSRSVCCHLCRDSSYFSLTRVLSVEYFHFPVSYHKSNNQTIRGYHTTYNKLNSVQWKIPSRSCVSVLLSLVRAVVFWCIQVSCFKANLANKTDFTEANKRAYNVLSLNNPYVQHSCTLLMNGSKWKVVINVIVRNLFHSLWLAALEILNKKTGKAQNKTVYLTLLFRYCTNMFAIFFVSSTGCILV